MTYVASVARPAAASTAPPVTSALLGVLVATAACPLLFRALGALGIFVPFGFWVLPALSLASIILLLVWLHGAFTRLRGRARYSPGMAVAGWFIPIANLFLPALILRDAWRSAIGRGGGIAFVWMISWWLVTAVSVVRGMGIHFASVDRGPVDVYLADKHVVEIPGLSLETFATLYDVGTIAINVAAYGLLALMVSSTARAMSGRRG